MNKIDNYTTKNIREFVEGDTVYIYKLESGFNRMYFCEFISFKAGVVKAKVISCEVDYTRTKAGDDISARVTKCCLWRETDGAGRGYNWFTKEGVVK